MQLHGLVLYQFLNAPLPSEFEKNVTLLHLSEDSKPDSHAINKYSVVYTLGDVLCFLLSKHVIA